MLKNHSLFFQTESGRGTPRPNNIDQSGIAIKILSGILKPLTILHDSDQEKNSSSSIELKA